MQKINDNIIGHVGFYKYPIKNKKIFIQDILVLYTKILEIKKFTQN